MYNAALPVGSYQFSNGVEGMVIPMYNRPNKFQQFIAKYFLGILWVDH